MGWMGLEAAFLASSEDVIWIWGKGRARCIPLHPANLANQQVDSVLFFINLTLRILISINQSSGKTP